MATNCRAAAQTDISASITGIAGPESDGNIHDVGLVYIGISCKNITYAKKIHLLGSREDIRIASCVKALELLIETVNTISKSLEYKKHEW